MTHPYLAEKRRLREAAGGGVTSPRGTAFPAAGRVEHRWAGSRAGCVADCQGQKPKGLEVGSDLTEIAERSLSPGQPCRLPSAHR